MTGQSSPSPEPWSQEAEKARLDKYGSSLDRWNVNHVCERIEDYPEFLAAIAALPGLREQIARTLGEHAGVGLVVSPEGWAWRCRCSLRLKAPDHPSMLQAHPVPEDIQHVHETHLADALLAGFAAGQETT